MDTINFNIVNTISKLGNKLQKSKMLKCNLKNTKSLTNLLCNYLNISEEECYIFVVVFIVQIQKGKMDLREFNHFLDLDIIQAIAYKKIFESLAQKRIISANSLEIHKSANFFSGKTGYRVHQIILDSIFENIPIGELDEKVEVYDFVRKVSRLINERDIDEYDSDDLFNEVRMLEKKNHHLEIVKNLNELNIPVEDRTLLYEVADDFVNTGFTYLYIALKNIFDSVRQRMLKSRQMQDGTNILLTKKLISTGDASFVNDVKVELTESAVDLLFGQDAALFVKKSAQNLISHEIIEAKDLFFNKKLQVQIDELTSSLTPENFEKLQQRMLDNRLTKGVAAVFYGSPGTGKSETAFQIAKATGRSIIHVDLSDTKSMWFGESEKKVKEIFTQYAKACMSMPEIPCPILLFNEADGILARRTSNIVATTDQTLNTIQNILLENFEKNEGIIIATTNLITNLDPAFERRFLFKLEFEKPDVEVIKQIWQSKIDWIDPSTLNYLATQFHFTGGEIDNIVRKVIMNEVINGEKPSPEKIIDFCNQEKLNNISSSKRLGFR